MAEGLPDITNGEEEPADLAVDTPGSVDVPFALLRRLDEELYSLFVYLVACAIDTSRLMVSLEVISDMFSWSRDDLKNWVVTSVCEVWTEPSNREIGTYVVRFDALASLGRDAEDLIRYYSSRNVIAMDVDHDWPRLGYEYPSGLVGIGLLYSTRFHDHALTRVKDSDIKYADVRVEEHPSAPRDINRRFRTGLRSFWWGEPGLISAIVDRIAEDTWFEKIVVVDSVAVWLQDSLGLGNEIECFPINLTRPWRVEARGCRLSSFGPQAVHAARAILQRALVQGPWCISIPEEWPVRNADAVLEPDWWAQHRPDWCGKDHFIVVGSLLETGVLHGHVLLCDEREFVDK